MIAFVVRFILILVALFVSSFASGMSLAPLIVACLFICAWLSIISLDNIFWWVFTFVIIFGLINYDVFGLYMIIMLGVTFVFEVIFKYLNSTANDSSLIIFVVSLTLSVIGVVLIDLIEYQNIFFDIEAIIIGLFASMVIFFLFIFVIKRAESFINLYTHGQDMRCHT